ncbi:malonyl-ACP O-methyltransferase BioC [uncultured Marinobacter sp.]|uniref:malonyl-ACP O-methyltransferase BioC n=1 Tax=uncultured Marinobacter sp. TaxID=187379 RepID=UPI00260CF608|nr:malonyl-ACP O-methyltransferase BioC [uncultured Marinobacter sp.]
MDVLMHAPGEAQRNDQPRTQDIARDFGEASGTYESASRLQRQTGNVILEQLGEWQSEKEPDILDLGCGTGWFTRKLRQAYPGGQVTGVDLSPGMIGHARSNSSGAIDWLVADAGCLPLPDNSVDIIFSNLMIQWCERPDSVLGECRRLLRPGGVLVCSTLLDGTLRELEQAWAKADPGRRHVNRFEAASTIKRIVDEALPGGEIATGTVTLDYPSPLALTRELKSLGAGYKGQDRRRTATAPGRVRAMCAHYPRTREGTVLASYKACWIIYHFPLS